MGMEGGRIETAAVSGEWLGPPRPFGRVRDPAGVLI
jgi:hypothetical protein